MRVAAVLRNAAKAAKGAEAAASAASSAAKPKPMSADPTLYHLESQVSLLPLLLLLLVIAARAYAGQHAGAAIKHMGWELTMQGFWKKFRTCCPDRTVT